MDIPEKLDKIMQRMMAPKLEERFPTPEAVMHALLPFLEKRAVRARAMPVLAAPPSIHWRRPSFQDPSPLAC